MPSLLSLATRASNSASAASALARRCLAQKKVSKNQITPVININTNKISAKFPKRDCRFIFHPLVRLPGMLPAGFPPSRLASSVFYRPSAFPATCAYADVTAIALGQNVLAQRLDVFSRNDGGANGCLNGHIEHLPGNQLAHLGSHRTTTELAVGAMDNNGQRIDSLTVDQHVDLDHIGRPVFLELIVHRGVTAGGRFETIKKV